MEEQPFSNLKISSSDFLDTLQGRSECPKCKRSRKYYCYTCYVPVDQLQGKIPCVQIPIKIDIIKHPSEVDGKSTAAHAKILAPDDVTVYTYPCIPDYPRDGSTTLGMDHLVLAPDDVTVYTYPCIPDYPRDGSVSICTRCCDCIPVPVYKTTLGIDQLVLAPDDVTVYTYPCIPDYPRNGSTTLGMDQLVLALDDVTFYTYSCIPDYPRDGSTTLGMDQLVLAPDDVTIYTYPCIPDYLRDGSTTLGMDQLVLAPDDVTIYTYPCIHYPRDGSTTLGDQIQMMLFKPIPGLPDDVTDDVTVYTYPCIPDYPRDGSVVLVFPGNDSLTLEELANQKDIKLKSCQYEDKGNVLCKESHMESQDHNSDESKPLSNTAQVFNKTLEEHHDSDNPWQISDSISGEVTPAFSTETQPGELQTSGSCIIKRKFENNEEAVSSVDKAVFKRAVFIDSTWNQTNRISTDERLKGLPYIMLKDRESKFWRHQRENPPSYLSTIEAIYYLLCDYHEFFYISQL
ncbi:DTW domain-containing protein 1 [Mytilus coruscus]|uniref:tRNA-uridine aminocarboxypropyltransferase 1 n=1 Tax=Mytilus coruscus TaxID=42192 RepID=A0A6J8DXR9_MYTCO|nr:DTW domain-containing protein 1 [Mytilus coruscus]